MTNRKLTQYQSLGHELATRVGSGLYAVGATLPREIDLAVEFGVSRNTVRAALAELSLAGMVRRVKRLGTVVERAQPRADFSLDMSAMDGVRSYVQKTHLTIISQRSAALPDGLVKPGGQKKGSDPWFLMKAVRRLRPDGPPVAGMDFYVLEQYADIAKGYGKIEGMVYEAIEKRFNLRVESFDVRMRATRVGKQWAEALACSPSTPAIQMVETVMTKGKKLLEVGAMIIPENRMELVYSILAPRRNTWMGRDPAL